MNKEENDDAFIGLDISIKDDNLVSASPTRSRKRDRPPSSPAVQVKRLKRPPPTPAPPAALVSLIQSDSMVLKYFKSLQANLDYDVDKWKCECQKWKKIAHEKSSASLSVKKKLHNENGGKRKGDTAKKKRGNSSSQRVPPESSDCMHLSRAPSHDNTKSKHEETEDNSSNIPITDEALFGDIDDSNDNQSICSDEIAAIADRQRISIVLEKLREAKKYLDLLGVSLVEIEVKTKMQQPEESDTAKEIPDYMLDSARAANTKLGNPLNCTATTIERILHRHSDEKVAGDIMASLKTLIKTSSYIAESHTFRSKSEQQADDAVINDTDQNDNNTVEETVLDEKRFWSRMLRWCHPFCGGGKLHIPIIYQSVDETERTECSTTGNPTQHPAAVGLNYVINILSIMGMYCSDNLSDAEWDVMFKNEDLSDGAILSAEEDLLLLQVGMRNRCRVAKRILSSLHVEITRRWASIDRASYLTEPTLHFHESDVVESEIEPQTNNVYHVKLYNRLVALEERIAHARVATLLHRRTDDWQKATELVIGYVASCAPSMGVEHHPKLPPVLSLCVLEALLSCEDHSPVNSGRISACKGWFRLYISFLFDGKNETGEKQIMNSTRLLKAIAYPIRIAVFIWTKRSYSTDDRIRDAALIELAAFRRLQQSVDGLWLDENDFESFDAEVITRIGSEMLDDCMLQNAIQDNEKDISNMHQGFASSAMALSLSLLTIGDIDRVVSMCERIMVPSTTLKEDQSSDERSRRIAADLSMMPLYCSIYVTLMSRKWDAMKLSNGRGRQIAAAFAIVDRFSPILESAVKLISLTEWKSIESVIQCCVLMSNGHLLIQIANAVLSTLVKVMHTKNQKRSVRSLQRHHLASGTLAAFIDAADLPTVRVINLKRRPDRLLNFMSFASREQLMVVKGPIAAKTVHNTSEDFTGEYAFDGKCTYNELTASVFTRFDGDMSDFVSATWRPGDLRAFDRDARSSNELVESSLTEKACALSHIASWIGVERTLSSQSLNNVIEGDASWYKQKLARMFEISGFARGDALLVKNENTGPSPCCVIFEDDAVLCDRFSERLEALLEELPRDFHFCSIGYSRPQRAPIVEYSSQLGIPSCLWYLTGYIISLDGARYLCESLPLAGPVDSWIGMMMCSNWDNTFGQRIGVGNHTRTQTKLPSRKDLSRIMRFRAYAALVPLCEQKNTINALEGSSRGWRDKDTDIAYSGNI